MAGASFIFGCIAFALVSCKREAEEWPGAVATLERSVLEEAVSVEPTHMGWDDSLFIDARSFYVREGDSDRVYLTMKDEDGSSGLYSCNLP